MMVYEDTAKRHRFDSFCKVVLRHAMLDKFLWPLRGTNLNRGISHGQSASGKIQGVCVGNYQSVQ